MNVRISSGLLRFRLSENDVATLLRANKLSLQIKVGPAANLRFAIVMGAGESQSGESVEQLESGLTLSVQQAGFRTWLNSPEIEYVPVLEHEELSVIVEKDLVKPRST